MPAQPKTSSDKSSTELTLSPPHANCKRSILRRLARRKAKIPFCANKSNEGGSIP